MPTDELSPPRPTARSEMHENSVLESLHGRAHSGNSDDDNSCEKKLLKQASYPSLRKIVSTSQCLLPVPSADTAADSDLAAADAHATKEPPQLGSPFRYAALRNAQLCQDRCPVSVSASLLSSDAHAANIAAGSEPTDMSRSQLRSSCRQRLAPWVS